MDSRDSSRIQEESFRSDKATHHKHKAESECIKTRFVLNKSGFVAKKYMGSDSTLDKIAGNLFVSKFRPNDESGVPQRKTPAFVKWGVDAYHNLSPTEKNVYRQAAIIDSPSNNETIASDAFHNFLAIHVREQNKCAPISNEVLIHQARSIWKALTPVSRLPFFLKGYLCSFYPRDLDGSIMYDYEKMSSKNAANSSISSGGNRSLSIGGNRSLSRDMSMGKKMSKAARKRSGKSVTIAKKLKC